MGKTMMQEEVMVALLEHQEDTTTHTKRLERWLNS